MKKSDIERMISLADDRYIDEIFQDKITGRRRNIFVTFTAVAAALALVACGISYLVSNAGNSDKITANDPIVSEVGVVDYSLYFQNTDKSAVETGDWSVETAGIFCYFSDSEYVKSAMPFDMSRFVNANCHFYYNYKDEVNTILIHASDLTEDYHEDVKILDVEVYERGELFSHLSLGKCKSMKRFDIDVYGFDFREDDNTIGVIFEMDGKEYLIGGHNISFDEIGIIMDSVIENGLWTDSFDLSKAEIEYCDISADITLEEANSIEPFAGHVPQIYNFGDMTLNFNKVSYNAGRDEANGIVPEWLYFTYYNGSDKDICLQYFTEAAGDEVQLLEKTVAIDDIDLDKLSEFRHDGNNHTFTIDFGDFKVNVWTNNCTDEELLECITAMHIGANGVEGSLYEEISLAEANNIPPYSGFVPQAETVGDMKLGLVQYNGSNIVLDYSFQSENRFSYIGLTYTIDKDTASNYSVMTIEQLTEGDIVFERYDGDDGRHNYTFAVDCKGMYGRFYVCIDGQNCTTGELYDCILTLLMEKSGNGIDERDGIRLSNGIKLVNSTLSAADKIKPFAGYIPQSESFGSLKLSAVSEGYFDGDASPCLIHMVYVDDFDNPNQMLTAHFYSDFKAITIDDAPNYSTVPLADIRREDIVPGKGFVADCGDFEILIEPSIECSAEDVWAFVSEIKEKPFWRNLL